jgi:hypothetical protein
MGDSMSLVLPGATSGSVTIDVPAVAGTNSLTLPASTGTLALTSQIPATGPAFSAYQSSGQALSSNTQTKLQFQAEEFDTASCFDSTTNHRFTPNVAGYYQVSGGLAMASSATQIQLQLYKNGSLAKSLGSTFSSVVSWLYGSCLVYLNGSTDYIELYGYVATGQNTYAASAANTYFQAVMVKGA